MISKMNMISDSPTIKNSDQGGKVKRFSEISDVMHLYPIDVKYLFDFHQHSGW